MWLEVYCLKKCQMKTLHNAYLFFSLLLLLLASSCERDSFDNLVEEPSPFDPSITFENKWLSKLSSSSAEEQTNFACLELLFPLSVLLSNNETTAASTPAGFNALMSNDDSIVAIDLVFPIEVRTPAGERLVLSDWQAMIAQASSCVPTKGWESAKVPSFHLNYANNCYSLVYPIQVQDEQGQLHNIRNAEELVSLAIDTLTFFTYPLLVMEDTGQSVIFKDAKVFLAFLHDCLIERSNAYIKSVNMNENTINCFEVSYPLEIVTTTETREELANGNELLSSLHGGWFNDFVYPLSFNIPDLIFFVVDDMAAFNEKSQNFCPSGTQQGDLDILVYARENCFEVVFPILITQNTSTGGNRFILNYEELLDFFPQSSLSVDYSIQYPIEIILNGSTETISISSSEELLNLYNNC